MAQIARKEIEKQSSPGLSFSMPWSRPFDDPIPLPGRRELVTLRDAGGYIAALPRAKQQSQEWQAATEALIMAAEDRGPLMHAHIGMLTALNQGKPGS